LRWEDKPVTGTTTDQSASHARAEHNSSQNSSVDIAMDFLTLAASGRAREALQRFGASDFIHHNPYFAGDGEALSSAMDENARQNPDKKLTVLRTIADEPLVAVHSHVVHRPGEAGSALVHIFRIEDGRIRELWDIGQDVPEDSPNHHGMF
jgi:predicted SnoaL-like aldol condensation-catalyzing enzyme